MKPGQQAGFESPPWLNTRIESLITSLVGVGISVRGGDRSPGRTGWLSVGVITGSALVSEVGPFLALRAVIE